MHHNPDGSSIIGARYDEARLDALRAESYERCFGKPRPPRPAPTCQWFARCDRPATGTSPHPAFPAGVPTCDRCHQFATGELRAAPSDTAQPCEPGGETLLDRAMRDA